MIKILIFQAYFRLKTNFSLLVTFPSPFEQAISLRGSRLLLQIWLHPIIGRKHRSYRSSCIRVHWLQYRTLTYIHLDCQLGFEKRYQRWPKYESVCSWSLTADQYFLYYLRASDVQSLSYSSFFVSIRQPSWFWTDNAKFKRKYYEQAVQMYLCQWYRSTKNEIYLFYVITKLTKIMRRPAK